MGKSFEARGLEPPMAGENPVRVVDDRRIEKAELTNALRDLRICFFECVRAFFGFGLRVSIGTHSTRDALTRSVSTRR